MAATRAGAGTAAGTEAGARAAAGAAAGAMAHPQHNLVRKSNILCDVWQQANLYGEVDNASLDPRIGQLLQIPQLAPQ